MYEYTLPRSDQNQKTEGARQSRSLWLLLIVGVTLLGGIVRALPMATESGGLAAWLPWMNRPMVTLYFPDEEGRHFVPISRPVASDNDLPRTALDELIRGPQAESGLLPPLPPGTTLKTLDIQSAEAYVDLTGTSLAGLSAAQVARADTSIHKTLTSLPQIESVVLRLDNRLVDPWTEPTASPLYFVMGPYLVPVNSPLPSDTTDPRAVLNAYLHGPPAQSDLAGLPPGTTLLALDFNRENGLVKVNLRYTEAVRALALADPDQMRLVLMGLIVTLTELPDVKAVMIDFEGHSQLGLGQCASLLRTPQLRPQGLNIETSKP